jgi:peptidoglycan/LPS O-acetylase OafA/YrhL
MNTAQPQRNGGLDALRATLTLLVLFHHTAITYGAIGGWFYREVPTDKQLGTTLLVLFCTVNQAFFMGAFFLIAGYFTPGAVDRNGAWRFARERLLRLGLPLIVFGFVLGPITAAMAQTVAGNTFLGTLFFLWRHGVFINGPLWFAQALLIFAAAYLVWHAIHPAPVRKRPFPANWQLAAAMLVTGAGAFALRLIWPVGEQVAGLQLAYFASYIVLFAAGCAGASSNWLTTVPRRQALTWIIVAVLAFPLLPAVVILAPKIPALHGNTQGGFNLQAATYAFWEPLVAWGLILGLLRTFTRRFQTLGPTWTALARRAFAIYIIHPPILVGIALAWRHVQAPHLVKFAVTGTATCFACFWLAGLLLRVPAIRRVV